MQGENERLRRHLETKAKQNMQLDKELRLLKEKVGKLEAFAFPINDQERQFRRKSLELFNPLPDEPVRSDLLRAKRDFKLLAILTKNRFIAPKLIYKASRDGFTSRAFYE